MIKRDSSLLIIAFSYNRAIQLDCLLSSTLALFKHNNYKLKIIYHTSEEHGRGYQKLIKKYAPYEEIDFIERKDQYSFIRQGLPLLLKNRNWWRFIKYSFLREKLDNFKKLTEGIIKDSNCEFTMFLTDDGYFYKDVIVPEHVYEKIRENPMQVSYRMYVGKNLIDCPELLEEDGLLKWNYYDPDIKNHWAYPFAVDVTIYHSKSLLKIIKPVFYHMPTTLESFVVTHCRTRKLLSIGYSPQESNYLGLFINRVSNIGTNFSGNIDTEMLNQRYVEGYTLEYEFPKPPFQQALIPDKIILKQPEKKDIVIKP